MRAKVTVNDESDKVDDVRATNKEVGNEDFLTISKIVEQKQIFEKRLKYRKVGFAKKLHKLSVRTYPYYIHELIIYVLFIRISWSPVMRSQHSSQRR